MSYICLDCGEIMDEPRICYEKTGVSCDGVHETVCVWRCSWCGSEEIEECETE